MTQFLIYTAAGTALLLAIFIVVGGATYFMHCVVDPLLDEIGKRYPKTTTWITTIVVFAGMIFIVYGLGRGLVEHVL